MGSAHEGWVDVDAGRALQLLLGEQDLADFQANVWERKPQVYKANNQKCSFLTALGGKKVLKEAIEKHIKETRKSLEFGRDLVAARYRDGRRESPTAEEGSSKAIWNLFRDGCTLQVIQPQRWLESLWRLTAALEGQLGCLVGINAYITPAGTQGLAPHYDDVELWICQTEGSKRWRLYAPFNDLTLPSLPSPDLDTEDIGEPVLDVVLQEGDVLYMPRGTVHQAVAQSQDAVHLTVSTYQRWAHQDLALRVLDRACTQPYSDSANPLALRQGLPWNFLQNQLAAGDLASVAEHVAGGLRAMADQLQRDPILLMPAAENLAMDFMVNRAPPHPQQLPDGFPGREPGWDSCVFAAAQNTSLVLPCEGPAEEVIEDEVLQLQGFVKVVTCLKNDIQAHMMSSANGCQDDSCDDAHCHQSHEPASMNGHGKPKEHTHASHEEQHDHKQAPYSHPESEQHGASSSEASDGSGSDGSDSGCEEGEDLAFPASYADALHQLLQADVAHPVAVQDLKLPGKEHKMGLVLTLWSEGFLCTSHVTRKALAHGGKNRKRKK